MKPSSELWPRICEPENLREAFKKASKGKWHRDSVRRFSANLDARIDEMHRQLLEERFPVGHFTCFKVFDPKERTIHAAAFPERVLHHAIMNVCEARFEQWLIDDTFACRLGKGRLAAIERAIDFAQRNHWFLKLDIRKYFENIDHEIMSCLLARLFKDASLRRLFGRIVACHASAPGRGLPIGSLTSQHFANAYLGILDRFVKETLRCRAYLRYMDDFVLWSTDKAQLLQWRDEIRSFLTKELRLELKHWSAPQRVERGMDYLGFRLFPQRCILSRKSRRRFVRKLRLCERLHRTGILGEQALQQRAGALVAFVENADSLAWRRRLFSNLETGHRARTASIAAAAGTTLLTTAARLTATGITRATATTTWVSGSSFRSPSSAPTAGWPGG